MTHPAENDAAAATREAGLPYCPLCGDGAHLPGECECQNLALGRCLCPKPGFEHGVTRWSTRPPAETSDS